MAETYHVYDYEQLPVSVVATLAGGLRDGSRSVMGVRGETLNPEQTLMAMMVDRLSILVWQKSGKKHGKPTLIIDELRKAKARENIRAFDSADEFWREREKIIQEATNE